MPPPLSPVLIAAVAWFHLCIIIPLAHYGHQKPRLHAQHRRVALALRRPQSCLALSRMTQGELELLADTLGIDTDEQPSGNWRFSPLERLFIALHSLSAQQASRRAQHQWGWAANSVSLNMQQMVALIINRLDAPDSRTFLLISARVCAPLAVLLLIDCFARVLL